MTTLAEDIAALMALGHDLKTATTLAKEDRERRFAPTVPQAGAFIIIIPCFLSLLSLFFSFCLFLFQGK